MSAGRLFHKVGAATLNARLPYTVRVRGTCSSGRMYKILAKFQRITRSGGAKWRWVGLRLTILDQYVATSQ